MGETPTISATANSSNAGLQTSYPPITDDDEEPPDHRSHRSNLSRDSRVTGKVERSSTICTYTVEEQPSTSLSGLPQVSGEEPVRRLSRLRTLFTPAHTVGPIPGYKASLIAAIKYSPLNICLAFIPVSWALHYTHQSHTLVFVFSALAIIPLAALLGLGTEQVAFRTSQSVGGLLNATLGNVVEMIIAGIALKEVMVILSKSSKLADTIVVSSVTSP